MAEARARPDWDRLFATAAGQAGLFTAGQAGEAGYSAQLLKHHVEGGRMVRVHRGIYRVVHFPLGEHEGLVLAWLWSEMEGVLSHATALALHGLSDVLPGVVHVTVPRVMRRRTGRPDGVVVHFDEVGDGERTWFGGVPVTTVRRTLEDCVGESPELVRQAAGEALQRGLVVRAELEVVERGLRPFGGVA